MKIQPIVLCGGVGSRLWPWSRESYPKQFISLDSKSSLLSNTIQRVSSSESFNPPILLANEEHRFLIAEELRQLKITDSQILLEPCGRNTAPAVALASFFCKNHFDYDPVLLVLPSDHLIADTDGFQSLVTNAHKYAQDGKLVTFGVRPTRPEMGYGYIRRGTKVGDGAWKIDKFVEKPDLETANTYFASNEFIWNTGIFMFKASAFLNELNKYRNDIYDLCELSVLKGSGDGIFYRPESHIFKSVDDISIDVAVMEKTVSSVVLEFDPSWSDVGSFNEIWNVSQKSSDGNSIFGDVIALKSYDNYIRAESSLVVTIGLKDFVVIQTKDALLISKKDSSSELKEVVSSLKLTKRSEYKNSSIVFRPWGKYEVLSQSEGFLVKKITVNPSGQLSLQKHQHRSEHWVVVTGTAKAHLEGEDISLTENQSIYIPVGAIHSLSNPSENVLEIIEVQVGSCISESDIVRMNDKYGRA